MPIPDHIGFIQSDISATPADNLRDLQNQLAQIATPNGTILLLPELWHSGFKYASLSDQIKQTPTVLDQLQQLCKQYQIILAGSLPSQEDTGICNTLYVVDQSGVIASFAKQHLFSPMQEEQHFTPATSLQPVTTEHGILAGLVCYDLRFPELAKQQTRQGAELLLVCGQWPTERIAHWRTLLQARAIENQVHVIGCNRVGSTDGTDFGGHSMVIAPDGEILAEAGDTASLQYTEVDHKTRPALQARFNTVGPKPWRVADRHKVFTLDKLIPTIKQVKQNGQRVVFTNGCFDILHEGHVTYLEAARKQGDCLIIGLNSDASISSIKGPDRPVNKENSRARLLAALGCVDYVVIFGDDTPLKLITNLMPDVLVKGADWPIDQIVGGKEVMAAGGEVKTIEFVGDFSTTGLIEQIRKK